MRGRYSISRLLLISVNSPLKSLLSTRHTYSTRITHVSIAVSADVVLLPARRTTRHPPRRFNRRRPFSPLPAFSFLALPLLPPNRSVGLADTLGIGVSCLEYFFLLCFFQNLAFSGFIHLPRRSREGEFSPC